MFTSSIPDNILQIHLLVSFVIKNLRLLMPNEIHGSPSDGRPPPLDILPPIAPPIRPRFDCNSEV